MGISRAKRFLSPPYYVFDNLSVLSIYSAVLVLFKGLRLLFIPKVPEAIFIPESRLSNEGLFFLGGIDFGTNEIVSSIQGLHSLTNHEQEN